MKAILRTVAATFAITGSAAIALAQAPVGAPGTMPPAGMHHASPARLACRTQIDSQSMTGEQRKAAMRACMEPHIDGCRQQAAAKGLPKGPDRREFMRTCIQGA